MATSLWSRAPGQNRAVPTHDSTLRKPPLRTAFLEFPQGLARHARFWADCRQTGSNRHPQSVHDQTVSLQGFTPGAPAFCERRQEISSETTLRQTLSRRMNHMSGSSRCCWLADLCKTSDIVQCRHSKAPTE